MIWKKATDQSLLNHSSKDVNPNGKGFIRFVNDRNRSLSFRPQVIQMNRRSAPCRRGMGRRPLIYALILIKED